MTDSQARAATRRVLLPSIFVTVSVWLLMALAQGIPTLCALAMPCPAPDVRVAPALIYGGLMLLPVLAIVWVSRRPQRRGWLLGPAYLVLGVLAVVGLGTVLFSGGFALGGGW